MASKDEVRDLLFNAQNGIVTIAKRVGLGDVENANVAKIEEFFAKESKPSKKRRIF